MSNLRDDITSLCGINSDSLRDEIMNVIDLIEHEVNYAKDLLDISEISELDQIQDAKEALEKLSLDLY